MNLSWARAVWTHSSEVSVHGYLVYCFYIIVRPEKIAARMSGGPELLTSWCLERGSKGGRKRERMGTQRKGVGTIHTP